jgi:hypothetical protein
VIDDQTQSTSTPENIHPQSTSDPEHLHYREETPCP